MLGCLIDASGVPHDPMIDAFLKRRLGRPVMREPRGISFAITGRNRMKLRMPAAVAIVRSFGVTGAAPGECTTCAVVAMLVVIMALPTVQRRRDE